MLVVAGEEGLGLVRIAEHLGHLDLLFRCQGLLAEEEHLEFVERLAQFGTQIFVADIGEVDIMNGGADIRCIGLDGEKFVAGDGSFEFGHEKSLHELFDRQLPGWSKSKEQADTGKPIISALLMNKTLPS